MSNQKPLFAWSYSGLSMYENCPRKYWAVKIQKVDDSNQYNRQGDAEHQSIEKFFKLNFPLHESLDPVRPVFEKIKAAPGEIYTEHKLCVDQQLIPCGYKDWNKAWIRGAGDLVKINGTKGAYFDWKSGKVRTEIADQADLTSLLLFAHFPALEEVTVGVFYYRFNHIEPHRVVRAEAPKLWNSFFARVKELEDSYKTDNWPATPNPLCGWCPYKACPFNRVEERLQKEAAKAAAVALAGGTP